ncbi:DUF1697 domain-containing protein [Flagellimonas sp.]|uniref:DUF1697 domain-containing protein n=1 Tax=Flagellimonas sp. TaxID=2058762 RepID=UPI003AB80964
MKTWIALLRGINVGGNHIIPMKELKQLMESNGFSNVRTYIQSGNVVFESPQRPLDKIGQLIEQQFGFMPYIFVLDRDELMGAVANCPYESDQGKTIHYFFLDKEPKIFDEALLDSLRADSERYILIERVFYLYAPEGIGRSKLVDKMGKALPGVTMTARNLNTINKLVEMVGEG